MRNFKFFQKNITLHLTGMLLLASAPSWAVKPEEDRILETTITASSEEANMSDVGDDETPSSQTPKQENNASDTESARSDSRSDDMSDIRDLVCPHQNMLHSHDPEERRPFKSVFFDPTPDMIEKLKRFSSSKDGVTINSTWTQFCFKQDGKTVLENVFDLPKLPPLGADITVQYFAFLFPKEHLPKHTDGLSIEEEPLLFAINMCEARDQWISLGSGKGEQEYETVFQHYCNERPVSNGEVFIRLITASPDHYCGTHVSLPEPYSIQMLAEQKFDYVFFMYDLPERGPLSLDAERKKPTSLKSLHFEGFYHQKQGLIFNTYAIKTDPPCTMDFMSAHLASQDSQSGTLLDWTHNGQELKIKRVDDKNVTP